MINDYDLSEGLLILRGAFEAFVFDGYEAKKSILFKIAIDKKRLTRMADKAYHNKGKRSCDGPLIVEVFK